MRWTRVLASLVLILIPGAAARAQSGTGIVTGTVTQVGTGAPIGDVTVSILGTTLGAMTNAEGRFTIAGVPTGTQRVQARRVGFGLRTDTVTVIADRPVAVDFTLSTVAVTLEQTVVIGYGTQKRADLTGSVSSVAPNADQVPTQSIEQALAAKAPGVQVTQASSEPGGALSIRIRGGSSIAGNNEPLYVIDGFPIENDMDVASAGNGGRAQTLPFNPLASINPADIESIDILKDASSTAIYGARGANGVVIITTKRGATGQPRVTIDSYTGMQRVAKRYDLLNGEEFAQFANEWGLAQTPVIPQVYSDAEIAAIGEGTDWQDEIFRSAPVRNLQIGVNGGTAGRNATKYSLGGGLFDQQGVVLGSDFRRISLRGTLDQAIGDRFRVSSNLLLSRVSSSAIPTNGGSNANAGAVGAALQYYPTIQPRRTNGDYTLLAEDGPDDLVPSTVANPLSLVEVVQDELGDRRALANVFGEATIIEGLKLRISGGADFSSRFRDTYYPRTTLRGRTPVNGEAIRGNNETLSLLNENTLTYENAFGTAHRIAAVAGYTRQRWDNENSSMSNSNFVSDITGYEDIEAGAQPGGPTIASGHSRWTMVSYLGRLNYTLLERYLFTVTGRRDGSSRFGIGNQWGVFPSAAFAWQVSEEPFLRRFAFMNNVDLLKLRASWGESGNPSIRPYNSVTRLTSDQYAFGGVAQTGYFPSSLGNPNLTWETSEQTDIGFDLAFWDERVDVTVDYYDKKTKDLLLQRRLPPDLGFTSVLFNAGGVRNKGTELGLNVSVIDGDANTGAFRWTTSFNYARNRNEVTDLAGDTLIFATPAAEDLNINGSVMKIGQPLGVFYGYRMGGILRSDEEAAAYSDSVTPPTGTAWSAGDAYVIDVNGDGAITPDDRTVLGNPAPKFTIGWTNSVGWKRFELNTVLEGSYGSKLLNLNMNRLESGSPRTNLLRERWAERWTPSNPDAKYPRIGGSLLNVGTILTSDMLEDGTFTRLRSVTLTYNVPREWLGYARLNGARVYVTGTNLVTWTDYSGFNPDVSSISVGNVNRGIDIGAYPLARTVTAGVNLTY